MKRRTLATLAAVASLALVPVAALAQAAYPTKPIKIIVPFPAGSGTDASARFVAQKLSDMLGQSVIVDNKPGANGFIAAQAVEQSAPDGHTLFVTTMTTQSVNPHIFKKLPYNPSGFVPVSVITASPLVLVVRNDAASPKSLAELTERAKKTPGKLAYASGNTSSRVSAEMYAAQAGLQLLHVPYKGTPQGLTDLMGGQIDLMFPDVTPSVPHVKDGKLRALAVTGKKRLASLPDVPTMAEAGVPVDLIVWSGALAPAGTPQAIVDKLSASINKVLSTQEARDFFGRFGGEPMPTTPAEMAKFLKEEVETWGRAVKAAGIQPE